MRRRRRESLLRRPRARVASALLRGAGPGWLQLAPGGEGGLPGRAEWPPPRAVGEAAERRMLGRRRGGSSLIPGKGDAALAVARLGAPPRPRRLPVAAHLAPGPGRLCSGILWPRVTSCPHISPSAPGQLSSPAPRARRPSPWPAACCTHTRSPSPSACVSRSPLRCRPASPRRGRLPAPYPLLSAPYPLLSARSPLLSVPSPFAALAPVPSLCSPSGRLPGMRPPPQPSRRDQIRLLPSFVPGLLFCRITLIPALECHILGTF